jgi:hypothetical protein
MDRDAMRYGMNLVTAFQQLFHHRQGRFKGAALRHE